jgi:hypothetical protein
VTRYETIVGGLVAIVAGLVYLARQVRKLAASVSFWAALPAEHRELMEVSRANTQAIADLTKIVDNMTKLDRRRRS